MPYDQDAFPLRMQGKRFFPEKRASTNKKRIQAFRTARDAGITAGNFEKRIEGTVRL